MTRKPKKPPEAEQKNQPHNELFFGLVGAVGTDLGAVSAEIARALKAYAYTTSTVRMSALFATLDWPVDHPEPRSEPYDALIWDAMDEGNALRVALGRGDALSLLAISSIERDRIDAAEAAGEEIDDSIGPPPIDRRAWVLRSCKTRAEVSAFRDVYGARFVLVAAHMDQSRRVRSLRDQIAQSRPGQPESQWEHAPSQLIDRDWHEHVDGGQDVSGTFGEADFFVDANDPRALRRDVRRLLRVLFGDPFTTPTPDEYAMFLAAGASRRSAELGRQVGAAIVTPRGSVISLGTNEVPRAGGGPYLESDSDDSREFHRPKETNRTHIERITSQITDVVKRRVESVLEGADLETETQRDLEERLLKELPEAVMAEGRVKDLTEFGRATHAEMAALLDASRRGVPVAGATLMTYTFPCHNCARHIVEAGIARVVYIEPYLKSLALDLHADAIALQGAEPQSTSKSPVEFEPFTGAAPRRYLEMFDAAWRESRGYLKRKDAEGRPADFDASMPTADPVIGDLEQAMLRPKVLVYRRGERRAIELLQENLETNGFTIKEQL